MSALQIFDVSGTGIRFGATEHGQPYAVASDYAKAMGYRDAANALRLLDEDEKGTQIVSTSESNGRVANRPVSVIYEDGMWELIFRSTLPGAKAIKKQVKAILRQIRETGSYTVAAPQLTNRDLARMVLEEADRADQAEAKAAALEPAAAAYDRYLSVPSNGRLLREVAKAIGWQEKALRSMLADEGVLITRFADCGRPYWDVKAEHLRQPRPRFRPRETAVQHGRSECLHYTLYVLQPGVDLILRLIDRRRREIEAATVNTEWSAQVLDGIEGGAL